MQPSDYSILATAERSREAVAYWRARLAGIDPLGPIGPAAAAGPGRRSIRVATSPRGRAALAKLAQDDAGRFTVLTAGIALALCRYFNREQVVIQAPPLAGGGAPLNGDRTVPLVFDAPDQISLRDFLQQSARGVETAYEHEDFPVATMCRLERGVELSSAAPFSLASRALHEGWDAPPAPLHLELVDLDSGIIELTADPDAVEPVLVEGLALVLPAVLDGFADLGTAAGDLPRLPASQHAALAREWSRHPPAPVYRSVVSLFEARAHAAAPAAAVRMGGEVLTYAQLNARANRLAHALIGRYGGSARPIAIWMDRSPWMVTAVLGVLKAGLPYLPIDADCPPERAAFMLRDAGAAAALIDAPKTGAAIACPALLADREFAGPDGNPGVVIASEALAYLIYTSGSTGAPKGCAVEHGNLSNYLQWAIDYYWASPDDGSMALFTPLSFDLTVPSLFCPLLRGRTLTIHAQALGVDELLRRQFAPGSGIDAVKLTPSHVQVLDALRLPSTGVSLAIVGGEALTARHVETLRRLNPRMRIVNEYGPTEATVGCVVKDIGHDGVITIGVPIAGMRTYVMDGRQQLVPFGVRGELVVAGASVARGYHGRDDLTRLRFLPDPFVAGSRMYRTGDAGRRLPGGEFECAGRIDDQVKVRGYRVAPGEIEHVIRQAGARDAVVIGRGEQLVAYVAPATVDAAALRHALTRALPAYMVPGAIVPLEALPLTANGKVDRTRLPAPAAHLHARAFDAPRTADEQALARIWAGLFQLPRVGINDDFFDLGGHSLLAMTMMQRIHDAFGVDVSIGDILERRTIAALAPVVAARHTVDEPPITRLPTAADYAVSHGQRRLWIISRIEEDSPAYNVSSAFELRGPLDTDALQSAFDALVERHESLRTVFTAAGSEPRQRVLPPMRVAIERVSIGADAEALAGAAGIRVRTPFDLGSGPLLRATLFEQGPERATLLLTLHHIVSDGWSMRVLIGDLLRLYEARRTATAAVLPPLEIQYKDYAAWQRAQLESGAMRAHRDYWVRTLAGTPALALPADFERPPAAASRGRHHYTRLEGDLARALKALGARHGASLFMTLTALVKALLHRHTGQTDIAVGSPIAGRTRAELAPQIGFYVNTLVLRDEVHGAEPFTRLLERVARTATMAYEHQAFPFDTLVEELDLVRDVSRAPLFDVMVTFDVEADEPAAAGELSASHVRIEHGVSKFDLTFAFAGGADGLDLEIEYRDDLFLPARIETLAAHLTALARAAVAGPAAAIETYDLGSPVPPGVRAAPRTSPIEADVPDGMHIAPRDARELALISALESVLGRTGLGAGENFFFAGGDSIKAIQMVTRLAREGWHLRVRDVFEAPRLELLARRLTPLASQVERAPAEGDVPLTPIQRWFFLTQPEARHHYNQSVMIRFPSRIDERCVREIGRALVRHHDALRLRFREEAGAIRQWYGGDYDPVDVHDLRRSADPAADLDRHADAAQGSLDIEHGPLARFVLFQLPDEDRLLAAVHHLAIDGVSWRILLDDLRTALAQAARGETIALGGRTDSYQTWARALDAAAADAALERAWWDGVDDAPVIALPRDADAGTLLESDAAGTSVTLDEEDTRALLSRVHRAYNTRTTDVLLAALASALHEWAGPGAIRVDIEGHGRDAVSGVDLSRTVGWFTTLYPIVLPLGGNGDAGEHLKAVKELLRRTPGRGAGYGLLGGGRPSGAEILFNFLGQFDTDVEGFAIAEGPRGRESGPGARMTHPLVIGGWIAEGRLHLTVRYASRRYRAGTAARLAQAWQRALESLIAHCRERTTAERTLSDFRYQDGSTAALAARLGAGRVEDVYPLSPVQAGMLYHTALAPGVPLYVEQFTCAIAGTFDEAAFRTAWDAVIDRHTALRTAFEMHAGPEPLQVVYTSVDAPWSLLDWRALPQPDQQQRLDTFAREDRARPIDVSTAPVMRFTLIRLGDQDWRFFWTSHHAVLDGWSTAIVLQDVFAFYHAAVNRTRHAPPAARPYGEYIDWLRTRDTSAGAAFWKARLSGVTAPTPLPGSPAAPVEGAPYAVAEFALDAEATASLEAAARAEQLTLNTVARGMWARLLGEHARTRDVVFGATVAGRPASLDGVDAMAGLFINTLPVRVRLDDALPVAEWLRALQQADADLDQHAHVSLAAIQRESGLPARVALFDTILVFENYPVDESIDPAVAGVDVRAIAVAEQTNYPLTLTIVPGERLTLRASYDTSRYPADGARALLHDLAQRLQQFARHPQARPGRERGVAYAHESLDVGTARTLAAALCARYSANEDLSWSVDGVPERGAGAEAVTDLAFFIAPRAAGGVTIEVSSMSGRFDEAFLRRTETHVRTLADAAAASGGTALDRLPVLSPAERQHILHDFNDTRRDWDLERTIAQHFEDRAAAHPDRVALLVPAHGREEAVTDEVWTYGALNARANQLARLLTRAHGVGPDTRVGVLAERSSDMVAALLAVLKAGGAYVPLDPEYPAALLAFMVDDAAPAVILAQEAFAHLVAGAAAPVIVFERERDIVAAESPANLPSRVTGEHLAYVIYTSGSTGRPKGAMNTHRGIANRLLWMQEAFGLTEDDRVLQKTPFSFDVSVWEFFWPLMTGARLVMAKPGGHRDAGYLVSLIEHAGITTLHFVPSMLQAFIEDPGAGRCRSIARVIASGEAITPALLARYLSRLTAPLHNLYGPTEAAVDVTAWACSAADTVGMVPIGRPIANIQLYILDSRLEPVPEGVTGELFLGGVGVGRGYLGRPDLTAERFIANPFGGGTLYRTGDLARYRAGGVVDFLGRIDHQVKIRGFRIELGEIESALIALPEVREAAVLAREDHDGTKQLVAYAVVNAPRETAAGIEVKKEALRDALRQTLAAHMVPGVIMLLEDLPKLPNGKIDRKALPAPAAMTGAARGLVAPRDPMERTLARIWSDVLGLPHVGVTDDFFELGGHSLSAIRLMAAIHAALGRTLPLAALLRHTTIERMAVALGREHDPDAWRPLTEIRAGGAAAPLFLLPGAGGNVIYFHPLARHLAPGRPIYGLQAIGLDGVTPPLASIEAVAAANIGEMRRAWPAGPYYLAGHSFGGRVGLEMARQLHAAGERVALLAVLDTAAPIFEPAATGPGWTDAHWLERIAREIEIFFGVTLPVTLADLAPLARDAQLSLVIDQLQRAGAWAPGSDPAQLAGYLQVYKTNSQMPFAPYAPGLSVPIAPIALFKALETDPGTGETPAGLAALVAERAWGWDRFAAGEVNVFDVPGSHLSMLADPHAATLAARLDEAIASAEAAPRLPSTMVPL